MSRDDFKAAQTRILESAGVTAESRFVDVAVLSGRAHVLVSPP